MEHPSDLKFTIQFSDPDFDDEELETEAQKLFSQLRELDDVQVKRVIDPHPPEGNKAFGGVLVGLLMAEVSVENAKKLMGFLGDRLSGKVIELKVEGNGRSLEVRASSQTELMMAIEAARKFVEP